MTARARIRGHEVTYYDGEWRTADGKPVDRNSPCAACGEPPTPEGHDACLGELPGVFAACCGHGHPGDAYTQERVGSGVGDRTGILARLANAAIESLAKYQQQVGRNELASEIEAVCDALEADWNSKDGVVPLGDLTTIRKALRRGAA